MMRILATGVVAALWASSGCGPSASGQTAGLQSIEVQPPNATVTFTSSGGSPVDYIAIGHYDDGHTEALADVAFALDADATVIGTLNTAEFTASGAAAGTGTVTATAGTVSGATGVSVIIHQTHVDPTAPAGSEGNFPDQPPTGTAAPTLAYPLDNSVMPVSVNAPNVQWEGTANTGDLFRVHISAGLATVDTISAVAPGFTLSSLPSTADWAMLLASAHGSPITFAVDHWDILSGAQRSAPVSVKAVSSQVTGVIYYWDLSQGQMQRIDSVGRALAIPNPPGSPADANNKCVACHVVSRDGRYLAGELWGGGDKGAVFDLSNPAVTTMTATSAPTVAPVTPTSYTSLFSTFNSDGTRLLTNPGTQLALVDPLTGTSVAALGAGLPAANAAHPSWSPDGASIVFVNNITLGADVAPWAVDYDRGDLQIIPVTGPDTFGAPQPLVDAATAGAAYAAPSWPTFTPDSKYIVYAAGTNSRGRSTVGTTEVANPGSLFLVATAGGTPIRLDNACSGAANCYLPNFSPYDDGAYIWLVFYSLRDYGNSLAGTKGTQRRQMWVTGIDKSKLGSGTDPSLVPYWLPFQDSATDNMSAFWALPPPIN